MIFVSPFFSSCFDVAVSFYPLSWCLFTSHTVPIGAMSFSKVLDSSSPGLWQACAGNRKLGEATISVTRIQQDKQMNTIVYVLGDAMIEDINTSGSSGNDLPQESFTINFTTITSTVTTQIADSTKKGVSPFGWDLKENKAKAPA